MCDALPNFKWVRDEWQSSMAVIAELRIPADEFELGCVTRTAASVHVELERIVPVENQMMPFFWASGPDLDAFERAVEAAAPVEELSVVARVGDRTLYRVEWGETDSNLRAAVAAGDATIVAASGGDPWSFRMRFRDQRGLRDFHEYCRANDVAFTLDRVYTLEQQLESGGDFGTTPRQHEALLVAVERGYFEVPRGVTLTEIAETFDISQQAASERVRRGANAVLRAALLSSSVRDDA